MPDVIVIGAGLAGLVAAIELTTQGAAVTLLDKGRSPGGRLATRRLSSNQSGQRVTARLDHGAQFFTVRSPEFAAAMADWPVHVWHHGPATAHRIDDDPATLEPGGDGHPRYVGRNGMNGIATHLAHDLDVRTLVRVDRVDAASSGWTVAAVTNDGQEGWHAPQVLITCPLPQTLQLLERAVAADEVVVPDELYELSYDPCVGLLLLGDPPPVDHDGPRFETAVQFEEGPVRYLADNASKDISPVTAVTLHASGAWSRDHFDDDDDMIRPELLALAIPWLGGLRPTNVQVKRWRYAAPVTTHPERALQVAPGLVLAGDIFGEPKVEGAARSGLAAAELLGHTH